jgi:hypothetical protein
MMCVYLIVRHIMYPPFQTVLHQPSISVNSPLKTVYLLNTGGSQPALLYSYQHIKSPTVGFSFIQCPPLVASGVSLNSHVSSMLGSLVEAFVTEGRDRSWRGRHSMWGTQTQRGSLVSLSPSGCKHIVVRIL